MAKDDKDNLMACHQPLPSPGQRHTSSTLRRDGYYRFSRFCLLGGCRRLIPGPPGMTPAAVGRFFPDLAQHPTASPMGLHKGVPTGFALLPSAHHPTRHLFSLGWLKGLRERQGDNSTETITFPYDRVVPRTKVVKQR